MESNKHKYIFYFYPKYGQKKGKFIFFKTSGAGKLYAEIHQYKKHEYDYKKLY